MSTTTRALHLLPGDHTPMGIVSSVRLRSGRIVVKIYQGIDVIMDQDAQVELLSRSPLRKV